MTSPVDIRPDQLEIVQDILLKHLPADVKVWVFGSRANWTTKDSSDLDLALEGESKLSHKVLGALKDAFADSALPYTVDVVDLNRIGDSFRQIVESQRVLLPLHLEEVNHRSAGKPEKDWLYRPQFPEHWSRRSLYSMAQWVNGLAFRNIQFSGTGMPVIKIAEIKNGISGQTKFTEQIFDESVRVNEGDLLFSWSGQPDTSIDASWWRGPEGWLNQHIFRVTPEHDVDEAICFFYCLLRYLRPNFVAIARNKQTTGLGHVTKQDLEEIEAALPPLSEQRAIAHVLGTLDDKIELNRRMNETLEAMARALFKSWFVYFEPVRAKMEGRWRRGESLPGLPSKHYDLFPDRLVDSELGEIPEGWGVRQFSDIATQLRDNEHPAVSPDTEFSHFSIPAYDLGQTPKLELGANIKSTKSRVSQDTVLLSKLNPEIKRVWLVDVAPDERAICSTEFLVLKARPPFQSCYVYCLALSPFFRQQIESIVTGTSKSHQRAPANAILSLEAAVPPAQVIEAFQTSASGLLQRSMTLRREALGLAAQRDALLPGLVSGELQIEFGCRNTGE